ncbi:MAG: glycosyltransferase [Haliscomenobacter sp.]|nr:glycosyltransferase [Haliscomenobacter sp.]
MMDICAELGIPLFVYFLGYDGYIDWVLKKYGHRYKEFNEKANGVICVSRDLMEQLKKMGVREEILHYNPCGPNNLEMNLVEPEKSRPIFVAVGAFDERKGPHFTIQAFAKASSRVEGMELHMVGEGPLWERCKKLALELGVADRVFFLGKKTLEEIHELESRARAFVQHSIVAPVTGDSEGTPVAIVEASAAGLPVIATRHAGIKDTIVHGETGFLVGETEVEAMAEYMALLASEPQLAGKLGKAGAQFARLEFAQEKLIGRLWTIISSAWNNPH